MRVIVANCSVIYTGRGDTTLGPAIRAIVIKDDGCIAVHNDKSNKPLNYMGKGNLLTIEEFKDHEMWSFDTSKESLQVKIHHLISDTNLDLDLEEVPLVRDGTEKQLQAWLALHPEIFGQGYSFIQREYPTGAGPVDLLVADETGQPKLVEVKRTATLSSIGQIKRYIDAINDEDGFEGTTGILAAVDIRPKAFALAEKRGIRCVVIPSNWREISAELEEELPEDEDVTEGSA
jgi:RecB family endonuclease NucS